MNVKALIKCLPLQTNPEKYQEFVKKLDYKKLLEEDPICIKDKLFGDKDLVITDLASTTKYLGIHKELNEKYKLYEVADADSDFENVIQILDWLTENTFYNGAMLRFISDNTIDILKYAFGKTFRNSINCRLKAIAFADCLVAIGIKAYPICMQSTEFRSCHFTCRVYINELLKWCVFDPSFGCWFSDKSGNPLDVYDLRKMFLHGEEPAVIGYNLNGTAECFDVYINAFIKCCISNLSTWRDNSMVRRNTKKMADKKKFNAKLPNQ